MTTLANANLLDDSVANSGSLKNQRLNKTAQSATNPVPNTTQDENQSEEEDYNEEARQEYEQPKRNYPSNRFDSKASANKDADEKKILGMKPALFYGLLAVGLVVGGYFVYNKFIKKTKKVSLPDAGANPAPAVNTPVK